MFPDLCEVCESIIFFGPSLFSTQYFGNTLF